MVSFVVGSQIFGKVRLVLGSRLEAGRGFHVVVVSFWAFLGEGVFFFLHIFHE